MLSLIVKIGRDPPLNGSSCCESLFSSIPFLTDQVDFFRANIPLAHIYNMNWLLLRAPASELSPLSLFRLADSQSLHSTTIFCTPKVVVMEIFRWPTRNYLWSIFLWDQSNQPNLCNHINEISTQVWPCHCESRHCWCTGNIMMYKLLTCTNNQGVSLITRVMLKLSLSTNFWRALTTRVAP